MKRKIIAIIAVICLVLCMVPVMPAKKVEAAYSSGRIDGTCPLTYQAALGLINEAGLNAKYWMFLEIQESTWKSYYFYGHSDDTHQYFNFQWGNSQSLEKYYDVSVNGLAENNGNMYCSISGTDSIANITESSSSYKLDKCTIYSNVPILASKDDVTAYLAGEEYVCRNFIDVSTVKSEYSADAPYVTDAYIEYDYVDASTMDEYSGLEASVFNATLHFKMPELEDTTYKAYVYCIPEGNFANMLITNNVTGGALQFLVGVTIKHNIFNSVITEKLPINSVLMGQRAYDYTTSEIAYDFKENAMETLRSDVNCVTLKEKASVFEGTVLLVDKVTFVICLDNGIQRGNYTKLSINTDGLTTTEVSGKYPFSIGQVASGSVDIVNGDKDLTTDIVDDTDIVDSNYIDVNSTKLQDNDDIIGFIKSGFGLLGESGLIAMLGDVFSFIPSPILSIMACVFGIGAIVIIVKFFI